MTEQQEFQPSPVQVSAFLYRERGDCKKLSLDYASKLGCISAETMLEESKKIYNWLTEDLK